MWKCPYFNLLFFFPTSALLFQKLCQHIGCQPSQVQSYWQLNFIKALLASTEICANQLDCHAIFTHATSWKNCSTVLPGSPICNIFHDIKRLSWTAKLAHRYQSLSHHKGGHRCIGKPKYIVTLFTTYKCIKVSRSRLEIQDTTLTCKKNHHEGLNSNVAQLCASALHLDAHKFERSGRVQAEDQKQEYNLEWPYGTGFK